MINFRGMNKIIPIFTLGAPRSGTTWLGNILQINFGLNTPSHPLHYGVLESNIYKIHKYFGDFSNTTDYIKFVELFSSSDYFLLCDIEKELFYENKVPNFYEFYLKLMDAFSENLNSNYWTTKLDPFFFLDPSELKKFLSILENRYEKVKFIAVQRNYEDYLNSYVNVSGPSFQKRQTLSGSILSPFLGAARYNIYNQTIQQIIQGQKGLHIDFKELKSHLAITKKIANYIGIEPINTDPLSVRTNTSFAGNKKKSANISMASLAYLLFKTSATFSRQFVLLYERSKKERNPLTWRLLRAEHFKEELIRQFEKDSDYNLVKSLKENFDVK